MINEYNVYFCFVLLGMGLVIGDYAVTFLKKDFKIVHDVKIEDIYRNLDAIIQRHIVSVNFTLNMQSRTWISDEEVEKLGNEITLEIYRSISTNMKNLMYRGITDDEIVAYITFSVLRYLVDKMDKTNK